MKTHKLETAIQDYLDLEHDSLMIGNKNGTNSKEKNEQLRSKITASLNAMIEATNEKPCWGLALHCSTCQLHFGASCFMCAVCGSLFLSYHHTVEAVFFVFFGLLALFIIAVPHPE